MMVRYVLPFLAIVAALAMACSPALAQDDDVQLDTVHVSYELKQGQVLTYRVISYDSIMIYDVKWRTLARERVEIITYQCDSVLRDGYIVTVTTQEYGATEKLDTLPPVVRTDHPWVDRPIRFLMDRAGRRVDLVAGDTVVGNAPGGPFAPALLPHVGSGEMFIGQSGTFGNEQWLTDNSFPPIWWSGGSFRLIPRRLDTLGHKGVLEVGLTDVANLTHQVPGNPNNPVTRTVVNGGGEYYFAPDLGYPVGGTYSQIARFTMEFPDGKTVDGRHLTSMSYELMENP